MVGCVEGAGWTVVCVSRGSGVLCIVCVGEQNTTLPDKPSLTLVDALGQLYSKTSFSSFDELRLLKTLDYIALRNHHTRAQKAALELMQKMVRLTIDIRVCVFGDGLHSIALSAAPFCESPPTEPYCFEGFACVWDDVAATARVRTAAAVRIRAALPADGRGGGPTRRALLPEIPHHHTHQFPHPGRQRHRLARPAIDRHLAHA